MIGVLLVGLVTGIIVRILVPLDVWRHVRGPRSWLYSLLLGLAGAIVGYLIFTVGLGIGDTEVFDWGSIFGAIIGGILVLIGVNWDALQAHAPQGRHTGLAAGPTRPR